MRLFLMKLAGHWCVMMEVTSPYLLEQWFGWPKAPPGGVQARPCLFWRWYRQPRKKL